MKKLLNYGLVAILTEENITMNSIEVINDTGLDTLGPEGSIIQLAKII